MNSIAFAAVQATLATLGHDHTITQSHNQLFRFTMFEQKCALALRSTASHMSNNLFSWSDAATTTIAVAHQASLKLISFAGSVASPETVKHSEVQLSNPNSTVVQVSVDRRGQCNKAIC